MNILFDGNFLFHKSFGVFATYFRDQDMEEVLKNKENQQVLIRKCVTDMCYAINKFKDIKRVAIVIDSSSWRYTIHDDYKYALTKVREPYYKYFLEVLNIFEELLRKRGLIVSRVNGAEGDDLLYVWSIYFGYILDEKLVIVTADSDIKQIINKNVSIFNNTSKNQKLYCIQENEIFWNDYLETDIQVEVVKPFEILLYKIVMGDASDNIPKIKKGFGDKAFQRFIDFISPYKEPKDVELLSMARWIASRLGDFIKVNEELILGEIIFNLKLAWLNLSVYNNTDYKTTNGKSLLENILDDINNQKNNYSYNKKYSLEEFYGMMIK